jgi:hypothetical protein
VHLGGGIKAVKQFEFGFTLLVINYLPTLDKTAVGQYHEAVRCGVTFLAPKK